MAVYSGIDGNVKIGANVVANISEWSLDIKQSVQDVTVFNNSWEQKTGGILGASGSVKGFCDVVSDTTGQVVLYGTTLLTAVTVVLDLYIDSTNFYRVTAYIDGMKTGSKVDGVADIEFSFVATGAVALNPAA